MTADEYRVLANQAIDEAAKLEPNWNSYKALSITPAALAEARRFVAVFASQPEARDALPYPMATGGMAFEWKDRSLWILPDGTHSWYREDEEEVVSGDGGPAPGHAETSTLVAPPHQR